MIQTHNPNNKFVDGWRMIFSIVVDFLICNGVWNVKWSTYISLIFTDIVGMFWCTWILTHDLQIFIITTAVSPQLCWSSLVNTYWLFSSLWLVALLLGLRFYETLIGRRIWFATFAANLFFCRASIFVWTWQSTLLTCLGVWLCWLSGLSFGYSLGLLFLRKSICFFWWKLPRFFSILLAYTFY